MKEATGELSMTVIVIIGAIAVVTILTFLTPLIGNYVSDAWKNIGGTTAGTGDAS